jgi:hypothetical protein
MSAFQPPMLELRLSVNSTCVKTMMHKGKAIPVAGHEGPWGCEVLRLSHFLDNRLTDGGEAVSPKHRAALYPQDDFWYSFLLEAESTPGPQCGWKD